MRALTRTLLVGLMLAATPIGTVTAVTTPTADAVVARLKSKGSTEIERRLSNLTAAQSKLAASTKLKEADKAALTKQLQDEVAGLTSIKVKLAADTTLAATRTDVASIVTDYRVYALMLPKARMVASADRFVILEEKLTALAAKLESKVGDDAKLQAKVKDMKDHIAASQATTGTIVPKLLALQPTDYNANHAILANYRASLKSAHDSLKVAKEDAIDIIKALRQK